MMVRMGSVCVGQSETRWQLMWTQYKDRTTAEHTRHIAKRHDSTQRQTNKQRADGKVLQRLSCFHTSHLNPRRRNWVYVKTERPSAPAAPVARVADAKRAA